MIWPGDTWPLRGDCVISRERCGGGRSATWTAAAASAIGGVSPLLLRNIPPSGYGAFRRPPPSPTAVNLSPRPASDFNRRTERRRPPRHPQGCPARRADPYRIRQHARNGGGPRRCNACRPAEELIRRSGLVPSAKGNIDAGPRRPSCRKMSDEQSVREGSTSERGGRHPIRAARGAGWNPSTGH